MTDYDSDSIFARILRGEIPCNKIYEDDFALAFHDIHPEAPIHIQVIPKGAYTSFADFSEKASDAEITGYIRAVGKAAKLAGAENDGYRLICNIGPNSHVEVPHLHTHILGGRLLGPKLIQG